MHDCRIPGNVSMIWLRCFHWQITVFPAIPNSKLCWIAIKDVMTCMIAGFPVIYQWIDCDVFIDKFPFFICSEIKCPDLRWITFRSGKMYACLLLYGLEYPIRLQLSKGRLGHNSLQFRMFVEEKSVHLCILVQLKRFVVLLFRFKQNKFPWKIAKLIVLFVQKKCSKLQAHLAF